MRSQLAVRLVVVITDGVFQDDLLDKAGVTERIINLVLRHRPAGMGQTHYSKVDREDCLKAISKLPEPAVAAQVCSACAVDFSPAGARAGKSRQGWARQDEREAIG